MINEQEFSSKSKNNSSFYVHNSELFANNAEENSIHEFRDLFETGTPYAKNFLFDE